MHQINDFRLQSVIEAEEPFVAPLAFFPDATQDVFDAHGHWLRPRFQDPETGSLIFAFQSYVLRTARHTILIDSCIGNDKVRTNRPGWHLRQGSFLDDLAAIGVRPEAIDFVLCTHLHADHIGWNTRLVDGRWVPTFPNARYVIARREYDFWEQRHRTDPDGPREIAFADSVLPVVEAGKSVFVDGDHQIEDGVWLEPAPGHTPGSMVVNLRSGDATAVLLGDSIHHPIQLKRPDWSCMACEDKAQSAQTRRGLIERYADTDTLMAPAHFAAPSPCRFVRDGDAFGFEAAL
ncbi:MAG: MBL fold metallo-hydrolase [Alphaproteobacteria bacterium]|jgi:glyoxylase-like metal-dependent hydrolase (beta-lactamase superfamily II)|nr:MBL fold metallo-hydrolase [Alphaproteobacteria bacterium]